MQVPQQEPSRKTGTGGEDGYGERGGIGARRTQTRIEQPIISSENLLIQRSVDRPVLLSVDTSCQALRLRLNHGADLTVYRLLRIPSRQKNALAGARALWRRTD